VTTENEGNFLDNNQIAVIPVASNRNEFPSIGSGLACIRRRVMCIFLSAANLGTAARASECNRAIHELV